MVPMLVASLWACTSDPTAETPPAPSSATSTPLAEPPPRARIDGEPILARPVVVGAIHADAVEWGIASSRPAIEACYEAARSARPGLAGKVLVKLLIGRDGKVTDATTHATSLRDPTVEGCINEQVRRAVFPPLEDGRVAVVHYPFVFPPPAP